MAYLNANIPPIECYVRSNFLQNRTEFDEAKDTYLPVLIFGVASIPHRAPLFHFINLFTLDWSQEDRNIADVGFSEVPGQHKCGHVIKLDNGNFAIQPNNRIRAFEPSFVTKPGQNVIERKLGTSMWSVENTSKWVLSDDDRYDYEVKQK